MASLGRDNWWLGSEPALLTAQVHRKVRIVLGGGGGGMVLTSFYLQCLQKINVKAY